MNSRGGYRVLWSVLILAQLAVPLWGIAGHEQVLSRGERFLLRCAPVDPVDPLRGRYIALDFDPAVAAPDEERPCERHRKVYVPLVPDGEGFVRLGQIDWTAPGEGPYLEARCRRSLTNGRVALDLPFDRFYLEEQRAPRAERAYRERNGEGVRQAHAAVRVLDGRAVLEELYLDGLPVRDYLDELDSDPIP